MTNSPERKRKLAGRVRRKENNSSVQWRSARTDSSVTDFGRAGLSDGINPTPINLLHWHRSEEHTSELQSLMRISYAVFCLKKKKHNYQLQSLQQQHQQHKHRIAT